MSDGVSDDMARCFGQFPHWSKDTHTLFPPDIRERIKVIIQGTLTIPVPNDPQGKVQARHPDCPFVLLPPPRKLDPSEPIAKILGYVAGTSLVAELGGRGLTTFIPQQEFKMKKPKYVNGFIIEFRYRVDTKDTVCRDDLSINVNGLSLEMRFAQSIRAYFCHPVGVNGQGWAWSLDSQGRKRDDLVLSKLLRGRFFGWPHEAGRVRLVLRPYGTNFAIFAGGGINEHELTWVNQGVTEHGPCTGVDQGDHEPVQLPCKVVHDVFHNSDEFNLRFDSGTVDLPYGTVSLRDVRVMFF